MLPKGVRIMAVHSLRPIQEPYHTILEDTVIILVVLR